MKTIKYTNNHSQEPFMFGYLNAAKILLDNIKKFKKPYHPVELGIWAATIWNLKHSIELLIKTLGINIDKEYFITHDLNELLKGLDEKLKNVNWEIKTNKGREYRREQLKNIVKKYYECKIFAGKKLTNTIDFANDIFRYIENKSKARINFQIFNELSIRDINSIDKDIQTLKFIFVKIDGELQLNKKN